jgi:hypothetical protein
MWSPLNRRGSRRERDFTLSGTGFERAPPHNRHSVSASNPDLGATKTMDILITALAIAT